MACSAVGCLKKLLIICNVLFTIIGLVLVGFGVYQYVTNSGANSDVSLIVFGAIIFLISFLGFCAALKESPCLLITFAVILLILCILQVGLGVKIQVETTDENINPVAEAHLEDSFKNYLADSDKRDFFNALQYAYHCCGVNGSSDYENIWGNLTLPASCCGFENEEVCVSGGGDYLIGCVDVFSELIKDELRTKTISCYIAGAVDLVGAIFSIILTISIKNQARRRYV